MFLPDLASHSVGMFFAAVTLSRKWLIPSCGLSPGLTFILALALAASAMGSYFESSTAESSAALAGARTAKRQRARRVGVSMSGPVVDFGFWIFQVRRR